MDILKNSLDLFLTIWSDAEAVVCVVTVQLIYTILSRALDSIIKEADISNDMIKKIKTKKMITSVMTFIVSIALLFLI